MWDISIEALGLLGNLVREQRIDCDLHPGTWYVALKERQRIALLQEVEETQRLYGYDKLKLLDRNDIEAVLATNRYCAGVADAGTWHLHPLNYTLGLATAAARNGAKLFERTRVVEIVEGADPIVRTPRGSVRAKHVVLCANAYVGSLVPRLRARIMPVGTYIVATEPLGQARIESVLRKNVAVSDMNFVLDYFRRSADHRMLFGGRVSYSGLDPLGTASATRRRMLKVFPQLADAKIEYAWGGYVDITITRAPDFGRLQSNVYYLQGFSGHGIALATIAGKLVSEAVAGQAERFDLFAKLQHRNFPGGPALRTPALVLAMLWYRLRDLL
jgi:gamma-glutamylputrescine oxidase